MDDIQSTSVTTTWRSAIERKPIRNAGQMGVSGMYRLIVAEFGLYMGTGRSYIYKHQAWGQQVKVRTLALALAKILRNGTNATTPPPDDTNTLINVRRSASEESEMTFHEFQPAAVSAIKSTPWVSSDGQVIVEFDENGMSYEHHSRHNVAIT